MANGETTPMTEAAYKKALEAIDAVLDDADASPEQVDAAQAALDEITVARNKFFEVRIIGRTAFLKELSAQLQSLIDSISENLVGDLLSQVDDAVSAVNDALASESKESADM